MECPAVLQRFSGILKEASGWVARNASGSFQRCISVYPLLCKLTSHSSPGAAGQISLDALRGEAGSTSRKA